MNPAKSQSVCFLYVRVIWEWLQACSWRLHTGKLTFCLQRRFAVCLAHGYICKCWRAGLCLQIRIHCLLRWKVQYGKWRFKNVSLLWLSVNSFLNPFGWASNKNLLSHKWLCNKNEPLSLWHVIKTRWFLYKRMKLKLQNNKKKGICFICVFL